MQNGLQKDDNGTKYWYLNDLLHRTDGPAIEGHGGDKEWWLNDQLHRTDGPAIEWADGTKVWYLNGQLHRTDGPAIAYADGRKYWYLNGEYLLFDEWLEVNDEITDKQKVFLKLRYG